MQQGELRRTRLGTRQPKFASRLNFLGVKNRIYRRTSLKLQLMLRLAYSNFTPPVAIEDTPSDVRFSLRIYRSRSPTMKGQPSWICPKQMGGRMIPTTPPPSRLKSHTASQIIARRSQSDSQILSLSCPCIADGWPSSLREQRC